ncbi:MAG TPA: hypothetical protein PLB62_07230 [Candidatus Sumerlaeota bacterium]|nr:hypothetical protein [Candidatus Sumerlaeota bacterium]
MSDVPYCIKVSARFLMAFALAGTTFGAIDKPLLEVNFGNPGWMEFMPGSTNGISVDGDIVRLLPKAFMRTGLLPLKKGDIITASIDASCTGIVPPDGQPGWCIGSATIQLYDASGKEYAHQDICLIGGDRDWDRRERRIMPDGRCAFMSVALANYGKSGEVIFRNLKVSVNSENVEFIGDSGFESVLGANFWFFKRDGTDRDGLTCWEETGRAGLDERVFAAGRQALRLSGGGATVVSKEFPYDGGTLTLSAWLRNESIGPAKDGAARYHSGVQVAGLDASGVVLVHKDLELPSGTRPWHFRQSDFVFPDTVKKVQVWLRMCKGAEGTLWLDEVRLRSRSGKAALPFDKDRAQVSVDFSAPETKAINHKAWAGVGGDWIDREDVQQCLPMLKAAGFEYIRMRDIANSLNLYPRDNKDGTPDYNWSKFDKLFDVLVRQYQFVPILALGHTPRALDRPGSRPDATGWTNRTPPSDMKKWGAFNEAIFAHAIERYGKEELAKWLWEIWNEASGEFDGTPGQFADLSEQVYLAKERIEKAYGARILMGLTSGGGPISDGWIVQRLKAIGKEHLVDHLSYHNYAGAGDSIEIISRYIEDQRAFLGTLSDRKDYQVGQTEWNCTAMFSTRTDMPWNATMAVKMARIYTDSKLDYSAFFHLVDHAEKKMKPGLFETGDFGLFTRPNEWPLPITHQPIPKPVYNAFVFLNELKGGRRLPLVSSNDPVDGLAVVMPDGSVRIVLTSYDEDIARQPYATDVSVEVKGLPKNAAYVCARLWAADGQYGNSHGEWVRLGKTPISDREANGRIMAASKYGVLEPPEVSRADGKATFKLSLPGPGIRLVELKPE